MKRFLSIISIASLVLLGGFAVGCGGDSDDSNGNSDSNSATAASGEEKQVRAVAAKVAKFATNGNAKGFCKLFVPGGLEEWLGDVKCEQVFKKGLNRGLQMDQFQVESVEIEGDNATVIFGGADGAPGYGESTYVKVDGKWYLDTPEAEAPVESSEG